MRHQEEILPLVHGKAQEQVVQRSGGGSSPSSVQNPVGWGLQQCDVVRDVSAYGRGFELDYL